MIYRENGQFKTSYPADQQIFPIRQDRIAIGLLLAFAVIVVPMVAPEYLFRAVLIPFLILSLAALGLNILVGYCGQISLGTGAFMAVGAYAAYNFFVRIDGMPMLLSLILGGVCAMAVGVVFGVLALAGLVGAGSMVTMEDSMEPGFLAVLSNQLVSNLATVLQVGLGVHLFRRLAGNVDDIGAVFD